MREPTVRLDELAYMDIYLERRRAHAKHDSNGQSMERADWDDNRWLWVLVEEVGEVASAHDPRRPEYSLEHLREELVQVGAMVTAWIVAIDCELNS